MGTGISWTDETWNPTIGCDRVSPGCDHCYAIRDSARQVGAKHPAYEGVLTDDNRDWSGRVNIVPDRLEQPLKWARPRRVFVNSMSDLFHPEVIRSTWQPPGWDGLEVSFLADVFATMHMATQHQFQVLTKRPQAMAAVLNHPQFRLDVNVALLRRGHAVIPDSAPLGGKHYGWNIWLGVTIESQTYAWRAKHLLETPAAVRFVSAEPLLSALDLGAYMVSGGLDWVIVGGESGPRSRPTELHWIEALVEQCQEEGVAPFVKQLGHPLAKQLGVHGKGTQPEEWPTTIRVQEWPATENPAQLPGVTA
jgi:protein gp37